MGWISDQKDVSKCSIREKVDINIDEIYKKCKSEESDESYNYEEYCDLVRESDKYNFYKYRSFRGYSGWYILRQEKANSSKVVFFGGARDFNVAYHDHLFQVDETDRDGVLFITLRDVNSGDVSKTDWLSPRTYFVNVGGYGRFRCQDSVKNVFIKDDSLIFQIHREKVISAKNESYDIYNNDFDYDIIVSFIDGKYTVTKNFPSEEKLLKIQMLKNMNRIFN